MSVGTDYEYGRETSTTYKREQAEKEASGSGKVSHVDFLKLLTTQLTNQDPLNPMQDVDFTGQLAQLQALDEQMEMTKAMKAMRIDTQFQAATSMIGKFVTGVDATGNKATGMVARVGQDVDGVYMELSNGQKVGVGDITNVWNDLASMTQDMGNASNTIGMWVEAGTDANGKPIRGIIEKVMMSDEGIMQLKLYGGSVITWDQIKELRDPTTEEMVYFTLPDGVREQAIKAAEMVNLGVSGIDTEGNEVNGIVAGADTDGSKVYLILYSGERIELSKVDGEAREPTADDAAKSLDGYYVSGLDEEGNAVEGIVVGAEEDEKGMAVILDDGSRIYFDALQEIRDAKKEDQARLHGMYAEGFDTEGGRANGIIVEKLLVDGELAVKLDSGQVVLCKNLTLVIDPDDMDIADAGDGDDGEGDLAEGGTELVDETAA